MTYSRDKGIIQNAKHNVSSNKIVFYKEPLGGISLGVSPACITILKS